MRTALSTSSLLPLLLLGCGNEYEVIPENPDVDPAAVTDCGFTPVSGTKLSVYDCNPVFSGTEEAWGDELDAVGFHATEVLGHAFYQLWYTQSSGSGYGLGYAVSGDGTTWEAHPDAPLLRAEEGWDADAMDAIQVLWDAETEQYVMSWQGYNLATGEWGMGIATSLDGVEWAKHPANPVLEFDVTLEGVQYCWPLALTRTGSGLYTGYMAGQPSDRNVCQMYPVYASSLSDWEPSNQPVLRAGQEYDAAGMASAAIVEFEERFYMFYVGFRDWESHPGYQSSFDHTLNLATSEDGVSWTKSDKNPLPVPLTDPGEVSSVAAQVIGSRIHLWVTDQYEEIGKQAVGYYLFEPGIEPHP